MQKHRTLALILIISLLNLVSAECPDFTNNPYYNHIATDEDGVEWVEDNNRPRTAELILTQGVSTIFVLSNFGFYSFLTMFNKI